MTSLASTPHRCPFRVGDSRHGRVSGLLAEADSRDGHPNEVQNFNQAAIRSVTLSDSLLYAIPALIHHWTTPGPISHRLINTTTGHWPAPIALQRLLVAALMLIIVFGVTWWLLAPTSRPTAVRSMLLAVGGLWLLGSSAHLNQVSSFMRNPQRALIPLLKR